MAKSNPAISQVLFIPDLHGERPRLDEVVQSDAFQNACVAVQAGDFINGGGKDIIGTAERIYDLVRYRKNFFLCRGNHERAFAEMCRRIFANDPERPPKAKDSMNPTLKELGRLSDDDQEAFMRMMLDLYDNYSHDFYIVNEKIVLCHANWNDAILGCQDLTSYLDGTVVGGNLEDKNHAKDVIGAGWRRHDVKDDWHQPPREVKVFTGHYHVPKVRVEGDFGNIIRADTRCGKGGMLIKSYLCNAKHFQLILLL